VLNCKVSLLRLYDENQSATNCICPFFDVYCGMMTKHYVLLALLFLLSVTSSCELDDGPPLAPATVPSHIPPNNPTLGLPPSHGLLDVDSAQHVDTLDYRTPFVGLFEITSVYTEAFWGSETTVFSDSVRLGSSPNTIRIPHRQGSSWSPTIDNLGVMRTNYALSIYVLTDGAFEGTDSFHLYMHMDQQPHTYSYWVTGSRL
jgi:hypothetical protein